MGIGRWRWIPLWAAACASLAAGELTLQAVDSEGEPVWARFEVRSADGRMFQPPFALRDRTARKRSGAAWYLGSFVAREEALLELPAGDYTVIVERGPEFERYEQTATVSDASPTRLQVELKPWIRMRELGWISADFHVHRSPEDARKLVLAEDLNLGVVFTMWNRRDLWEEEPWPENPVVKADPTHWLTVLNAEDERGGGAWMFHGLQEKLPLGEAERWFPPGLKFIEAAKRQRYVEKGFPWFDLEKPFWQEAPVVMALSPPDSIGLLHNHFNQYGVLANEAWGRPRDAERYPGDRGFVDASLDLNYRYWNLGFRIPASAGSASGVLPNPLGYNRLYVKLDEEFSLEAFYRALREGQSFVTNGPVLFFDAAELPGKRVRVWIDVRSREPLERIEIVANGKVIQSFAAPGGRTKFETELTIGGGLYTWIAARCYAKNDDTVRMAHSQPVFLNGSWDAQEDAAFFIRWIDELIAESKADSKRFRSDEERDQVIALYEQAREFYERKR